ncbi:MAG: cupredoxin domain-containing protein [Chloroflexi bacterium]|nr:cupredoxin domain-containing protein [Chloroflexota bacterium]
MKAIGCLLGVGLVAVVLVAVVATGARFSGPVAVNRSATVVLEDFRFTPNRIDAKVGVPLTVWLTNRGTERHDLNFQSIHMPGLGGVESILNPGETRSITLTFDQPGAHVFICTLAGHAAAGMTGAAYVTR